jgi:hypothetical protein
MGRRKPLVPWPQLEVDGEEYRAFRVRLERHRHHVWSEFLAFRLKLWRELGCPEDLGSVDRDARRKFGSDRFPSQSEARKALTTKGPLFDNVYAALGGMEGLMAAISMNPELKVRFYDLVIQRAAGRMRTAKKDVEALADRPGGLEELLGDGHHS